MNLYQKIRFWIRWTVKGLSVKFKFKLYQIVHTPSAKYGIILKRGFTLGNIFYEVETKGKISWFEENELKSA